MRQANEIFQISSFKYFPNPTNEYLRIEFNSSNIRKGTFSIYNQTGMELFRQVINFDNGKFDLKLPFLVTGVYTIEIRTVNERFINKIVIGW